MNHGDASSTDSSGRLQNADRRISEGPLSVLLDGQTPAPKWTPIGSLRLPPGICVFSEIERLGFLESDLRDLAGSSSAHPSRFPCDRHPQLSLAQYANALSMLRACLPVEVLSRENALREVIRALGFGKPPIGLDKVNIPRSYHVVPLQDEKARRGCLPRPPPQPPAPTGSGGFGLGGSMTWKPILRYPAYQQAGSVGQCVRGLFLGGEP
jgi:hypothetical protein